MSAMRPAPYAWTLRTQDTPILGVRLHGRVVETDERVRLPRDSEVVSWTIAWPDGAETLTTAADGGLAVDDDGYVTWPADRLAARLAAGETVPTYVQVVESDGRAQTYIAGTITIES